VFLRGLTASLLFVSLIAPQSYKNTAPESFRANGQVTKGAGGAASAINIQIDRYTTDADHETLVNALKSGGHTAFVEALHHAPQVGSVKIGQRAVPVRWARQRAQGDGRRIAVVTDGPVFFVGGGALDAKPTAGFDVAVVEFTVDSVGLGKGTMAPAARVKPGGPIGVEIEDYGGSRITLSTVTRNTTGS